MIELIGEDAPRLYNQFCREQMIVQILKDIRVDLAVCEIEGWDKFEYLERLQKELNHFKTRLKNG